MGANNTCLATHSNGRVPSTSIGTLHFAPLSCKALITFASWLESVLFPGLLGQVWVAFIVCEHTLSILTTLVHTFIFTSFAGKSFLTFTAHFIIGTQALYIVAFIHCVCRFTKYACHRIVVDFLGWRIPVKTLPSTHAFQWASVFTLVT